MNRVERARIFPAVRPIEIQINAEFRPVPPRKKTPSPLEKFAIVISFRRIGKYFRANFRPGVSGHFRDFEARLNVTERGGEGYKNTPPSMGETR